MTVSDLIRELRDQVLHDPRTAEYQINIDVRDGVPQQLVLHGVDHDKGIFYISED